MSGQDVSSGGALLRSRVADLIARADRGVPCAGPFLSEGEQELVLSLAGRGPRSPLLLWGGYPDAERKKAFFLPERFRPAPEEGINAFLEEAFRSPLAFLSLEGSGYRSLSHRDWLGAVLALGIERDAIGDVRTVGDRAALLVCERTVAGLIGEELSRVGADAVRVAELSAGEWEASVPAREYTLCSDTVPSARLDAVVGSLCRLAREKAKAAVAGGNVRVGGLVCEKPDRTVCEGEILSIRGSGKFEILSLSEQNKKGRYRLLARQYR
ncbi:MAG: hypothetical protein IJR89_07720 [Clostridia bacterium]|nr:hypothetical protein [Clostridia bacterium]